MDMAERESVKGPSVVVGKYNVRVPGDTYVPRIYGALVLDDSRVILSDNINNKLKILDEAYNVIECLSLDGGPYGVCSIGPGEVCVAMGSEQYIQFVSLSPVLATTRRLPVGEWIRAVVCSGDCLYVACGGGWGTEGQVRVYSMAGTLLSTWGGSGRKLVFSVPCDVAVSADGTKIHVADEKHGVVTFNRQGKVLWRYRGPKMYGWMTACIGGDNTVFACEYWTPYVVQLSSEGKQLRVLLSGEGYHGIRTPNVVCFDPVRRRLIVGELDGTVKVLAV